MSWLGLFPPVIQREFACTGVGGTLGREGEPLWKGRCAGIFVHSWPMVNQNLEIIDAETGNSQSIVPVPGRTISWGSVKSVILLTSFKIGLITDWRIVLEAFVDPITVMSGMSAHGNAQWMPILKSCPLPSQASYEHDFFAWEDGILRIAQTGTGGTWRYFLTTLCDGVHVSDVGAGVILANNLESDLFEGRVCKGRKYKIRVLNADSLTQSLFLDIGIIKDPIDQT